MLSSPRPPTVAKAIMGSLQLLLELGTAVWAWMLLRQSRGLPEAASPGPASSTSRALLHGRLALYLSLAFLVLNVRLPFWSAYLELLNRSRLVREFILENDSRHHVSYRSLLADTPAGRRALELEMLISSAARDASSGRYAEAKEAYLQAIGRLQSRDDDFGSATGHSSQLARASNNLAWLLVTCADPSFRDPAGALSHADRAVELSPDEGTYWNTLAVARYRARQWDKALEAFDRSMELRGQGDSYDWYFVAMVHAERGNKERARKWYDVAVTWNEDRDPGEEELHRFRVEAAKVLGLPDPPPLVPGARGPRFMDGKMVPHPLNRRNRS